MNETFKFSTVLAKIVITALIMAAIMVTTTKTFAKTANEKFVFQTVRLSLWYEGTQEMAQNEQAMASVEDLYPEELFRALEKHQELKSEGITLKSK